MSKGKTNIIIIAGVDSGKTFIAKRLFSYSKERGLNYALLDCDVGQSTIGPPGTLGLRVPQYKRIIDKLCFYGGLSPQENPLWFISCFCLLAGEAKRQDLRLIVDTTGYLSTEEAQIIKKIKINTIRPCRVLFIGKKKNFPLPGNEGSATVFLGRDKNVIERNRAWRRSYREKLFKEYFQRLRTNTLEIKVESRLFLKRMVKSQLLGLNDRRGFLKGLGIVEEVRKGRLIIVTPLVSLKRVSSLVLGNISLEVPEGRHSQLKKHFSAQVLYF